MACQGGSLSLSVKTTSQNVSIFYFLFVYNIYWSGYTENHKVSQGISSGQNHNYTIHVLQKRVLNKNNEMNNNVLVYNLRNMLVEFEFVVS